MDFGNIDIDVLIPIVIQTIALFIVVLFLTRFTRRVFRRSKYLTILRSFAEERGCNKPIPVWLFIPLEIAGVIAGLLFFWAFFQNAYLAFGCLFVAVIIAVFLAVKYAVPTSKTFALRENLTYDADVVFGQYKGRDLFFETFKQEFLLERLSLSDRDRQIRPYTRHFSVSIALGDEKIESISYENRKIVAVPGNMTAGFSDSEKMLESMPVSDQIKLYISEINGKKCVTLEKGIGGFFYLVEIYYVLEIVERILKSAAR